MNKKIIYSLLVIVAIFIITGCTNKQESINVQNNKIENNINKQDENNESLGELEVNQIIIVVNDKELVVNLENNSSSIALVEKLKRQDIVIEAHDYGNFEKVGDLGFSLPRNDEQITTKAGDLILYQGNQLTLYYDTNSWSFTKLGEVTNMNPNELKDILGTGDVKLTLKKVG